MSPSASVAPTVKLSAFPSVTVCAATAVKTGGELTRTVAVAVPVRLVVSVAVSTNEQVPVAGEVNVALAVPALLITPTAGPVTWVHRYALILRGASAVALPTSETVVFGATTCDGVVRTTVGGAAGIAYSAPAPSRSPEPHSPVPCVDVQYVPAGNARADDCRYDLTCAGVNDDFTDNINATTPDTCGAAMLVPIYSA